MSRTNIGRHDGAHRDLAFPPVKTYHALGTLMHDHYTSIADSGEGFPYKCTLPTGDGGGECGGVVENVSLEAWFPVYRRPNAAPHLGRIAMSPYTTTGISPTSASTPPLRTKAMQRRPSNADTVLTVPKAWIATSPKYTPRGARPRSVSR